MNHPLYEWYCSTKALIKDVEEFRDNEDTDEMTKEWEDAVEVIEASHPEIKAHYERQQAIKQSFSPEQVDHICYQIGEWYLRYKEKMWIKDKPNQHILGVAKEKLKKMICGD